MLNYQNFHKPHIDFPNRELTEIFLFQILKGLAFGLINIYVPVYLYTSGVPLTTILAVFTAQSFMHIVFAQLLARPILFQAGIKHSFAISMLLYTGSFFVIQQGFTWMHLGAWVILVGFANMLYASAHHSYLSLTIDEKKAGRELALMTILIMLVGVITPFVGSIAIVIFGFNSMFALGAVLSLASVIPLFFSPEIDISHQIYLRRFDHLKDFWKNKKQVAKSALGNGLDSSSDPLWDSLYIYKVLGGIEGVGFLTSIVSFIQVITNYIGGKRMDEKKSAFEIGIKGSIVARLLTFAAFNPFVVVMSETVNSVIHPLFGTAYRVSFYRALRGNATISHVVAHEMFWHASNAVALLVITVAVYFMGWYAFLVAGVFMIIGKIIVWKQGLGSV